jgi:hypothetical protein
MPVFGLYFNVGSDYAQILIRTNLCPTNGAALTPVGKVEFTLSQLIPSCPRSHPAGIAFLVHGVSTHLNDLPSGYPSYQTWHRRFQQWVRLGIPGAFEH